MTHSVLRSELETAMRREMDTAVRAAVDRMVDLIEAMQIRDAARSVVEQNGRTRTHFERVMEVMRTAEETPLSSSAIARGAGIQPGAARMVLYANKGQFTPRRVSPGRVKWTLADQNPVVRQEFACVT